MIQNILITGCSQGLGKALTLHLAKENYLVFAVSRNAMLLKELAKSSALIIPIVADIKTDKGINTIEKEVNHTPLSIIHNAGIAEPNNFTQLSKKSLYEHFETNCLGPLLITQKLLPLLQPEQRVLMITSGAAYIPIPGLLPYCASKAAFEQAIACLNSELNHKNIYFGKVTPGLMDTAMVSHFCESSSNKLPNRDFYVQSKKNNKLISPEAASHFISQVLLKTTHKKFCETYWNINEHLDFE